jgi:anti-anti-sigma factor
MFSSEQHGAVHVISGDSPLDHHTAPDLLGLWRQIDLARRRKVILLLEGIPLFDSAGLELLLDMHDECRARGGVLKLAAPSSLCHDILTATGMTRRLEVLDDLHQAIASFA